MYGSTYVPMSMYLAVQRGILRISSERERVQQSSPTTWARHPKGSTAGLSPTWSLINLINLINEKQ
jgi:hypothetical protein